jgi:YbbR domain-containing protein
VVIDLTKNYSPRKKRASISLSTLDFNFPFGIEVKKIVPAKINIEFDRKIWKRVPVRYSTISELPEELKFVDAKQSVNKVKISGPKEVLRNIGQLKLDPIDLSKVEKTKKYILAVELDDPRVQIEPNTVEVEYMVKANQSNRRLQNIPIQFLTTHIISNVSVQKVTVMLLVNDETKTGDIKPEDISVIAKIPRGASGKITVPLTVELPEGVALLKTLPEKVSVEVKRKL